MCSARVSMARQSCNLRRPRFRRARATSGTTIAGRVLALALLPAFLIGASQLALAQSPVVIYSFTGGADGAYPSGQLAADTGGHLYGTTTSGGIVTDQSPCTVGCGVVFGLALDGSEKVLYSFTGSADGQSPIGLAQDRKGNFYGVTAGGTSAGGTVFELTPIGAEQTLYTFVGSPDGGDPQAGLLLHRGKLYGTTQFGGTYGSGTVFEVTKEGAENVLYSFAGYPNDGSSPVAALLADPQGNLYGTTFENGPGGSGTVFKLTPDGAETILYGFTGGADGGQPMGSLVRDEKGNLYGTTFSGGAYGAGTVFEVSATGTEKVLYSFTGGADGSQPLGGLIRDTRGNLYGTTSTGGLCSAELSCGVVFELTSDGTEKVLHSFAEFSDGSYPQSRLIWYRSALYGTTTFGGTFGHGSVFRVVP